MIIASKFGDINQSPYMFAYSRGVVSFPFGGDETYTDTFDNSVWTWVGTDNEIDEILAVFIYDLILTRVTSLNDCEVLEDSFFWDDDEQNLYVHWANNVYDFTIGSNGRKYSSLLGSYASGEHPLTNNVFDERYYKPIVTGLSGYSQTVDPIKLGLIALKDSKITLINQSGDFDNLSKHASVGLPVFNYSVPDDAIALTDDMLVSVGYTSGTDNNRESITYKLIEKRLFENKPICPNIIDPIAYPQAGDNNEKLVPTAWGDIRRGIMLLTNKDDLTQKDDYTKICTITASASTIATADTSDITVDDLVFGSGVQVGTVVTSINSPVEIGINLAISTTYTNVELTFKGPVQEALFLVADPSLNPVIAVDNAYDKEGNALTIASVNLTACTVTIDKPASVAVGDLKDWSWEGQGYDIDGDHNNALDIIKDAFGSLAGVPYINSTFNVAEWDAATLVNTQPVGLSVQSDRGFVERMIEPSMTSLQAIVYIQGDGRITFINRDITASVSETIKQVTQIDEPNISNDPKSLVSELLIEYSPDFVKKESLSYLNEAYKNYVNDNYNINRRDPLSPVSTILVNESDSIATTEEIMSTSADPEIIITVENLNILDIAIFDIIGIDTGKFNNEDIQYGEVLSVEPNYIGESQKIVLRVIPDYVP